MKMRPLNGLNTRHFIFQHETAEGGIQAIRIKRYAESVFLPVRKLGGVGASKGKVTCVFDFISSNFSL